MLTVFSLVLILTFFNPLPLFSDKWSPALQIRTVLLSIQALLSAPNPDDPLANDVAEKWKSNEAEAIETGELQNDQAHFPLYLGLKKYSGLVLSETAVPYILSHF